MALVEQVFAVGRAVDPGFHGSQRGIIRILVRADTAHGDVFACNADKIGKNGINPLSGAIPFRRPVGHIATFHHIAGVPPGDGLKPLVLFDLTGATAGSGTADCLVQRLAQCADFFCFRCVLRFRFCL